MTLFEYLSVSFSVVLSLAAVRLVAGLSDTFTAGRTYWVHAAWVIHQLAFVPFVWWNSWSYRDVSWTFPKFCAVLLGISLIYYQAALLVPGAPADVANWREHFFRIRRQFFGSHAAWQLLIVFNTASIIGVPMWHPARATQAAALLIASAGLVSARPALHAGLALAILALWPIRVAILLAPGSLADR